jgi:hypothetical protein
MNLTLACHNILTQLTTLVEEIHENDFSKPCEALGNSTIGQHLRHTLEFFICLEQGFSTGLINYDKRNHDKLMETDKFIAMATLQRINDFIDTINSGKPLKLEVSYDLSDEQVVTIDSNGMRELVYNIEHAVHHMAIMKIGVREVAPYIKLPSDFGVAVSTVRHQHSIHSTAAR